MIFDDRIDLAEHNIYAARDTSALCDKHDKAGAQFQENREQICDVGAVMVKLSREVLHQFILVSECRRTGEAIANRNSRGHHISCSVIPLARGLVRTAGAVSCFSVTPDLNSD